MMVEAPTITATPIDVLEGIVGTASRGRTERRATMPSLMANWPWTLAAVMFVVYTALGMWMLYGADYAVGDALARAASARSMAHSRDQHLMAVGFYWMPLPAFAQAPTMGLFSRLGQPGLGMVIPPAFATALTIPVLARIGRDRNVSPKVLVPIIVLFAINPYTIFFAANGMSEAWQVLSLAGCFAAYLRWTVTNRTRDLGRLGLWLAISQLSRTESISVVIVFAALVAWQSPRGRRASTAMTAAAPAMFALFAWTITALIIVRKGWWAVIADGASPEKIKGPWLPDERTLASVGWYSAKLSLRFAPGILLALICSGFWREIRGQFRRAENRPKLNALALVLVGGLFPALQSYFLLGYQTYGDPRYYMPMIVLFTILTLLALERTIAVTDRSLALIVCSIISCISTFIVLQDPKISPVTGEPIVIRTLLGQQVSPEPIVNLDDWRAFTAELDRRVGPGEIVVLDTKVAAAAFLFSKHPTKIATERDKDTERELQLLSPRYTWAVYSPGSFGVTNPAIGSMLKGTPPKGKQWVRVDLPVPPKWEGRPFDGVAQLWHLIDRPPGLPPTQVPAPDSTTTPARTTATAPATSQPPAAALDQPQSTNTNEENSP